MGRIVYIAPHQLTFCGVVELITRAPAGFLAVFRRRFCVRTQDVVCGPERSRRAGRYILWFALDFGFSCPAR